MGGAGSRAANRIAPRDGTGTVGDWVAALGAAPLDFQPGTAWAYSGLAGIDTLGRIVEVASGLTFDEFLRRRIFEPLGMLDTGFNVPTDKMDRVVTLYGRTDDGLERRDVPEWVATQTLHSGGGGLWSTAGDYVQFAQMLVNRGALGDVRLLGTKTVELMATNHVGELFAEAGRTGGRPGRGFGLTMDVGSRRRDRPGQPLDRELRVERGVRHDVLGRPGRGDDGDSHGPNPRGASTRRLPERGASGDRRLTGVCRITQGGARCGRLTSSSSRCSCLH